MKPELKQKIKKLLSALAAVFGALLFLFLKSHRNQSGTAGKDALSAAEKAAEKAKLQKESEIEKADSNDLLARSAHAERNDTTIAGLKDEHKERVRARIRQELQR